MSLNKLMIRQDTNSTFWKEKFLAGSPPLFAQKVRNKIRKVHDSDIPYETLKYRELINYINSIGLFL